MLHDPGGLATQEPAIKKMDNYYSDSNNTSSSSSSISPLSKVPRVTGERKPTTTTTTTTNHNHRRSSDRAKDLHRLNAPQLIDLVLHLESQLDKTETRLKKYVLRCKEHVESETQASQQANKFRQKMTQVILDAQQEAAKAKQDVEEYKLRFENVQKELQRSREVVQFLENDKDEIQRALNRARERAREYKERSAVQLAREQGRRAGFEQGLEQGRLAVQIAHARAVLPAPANTTTTTTSRAAPRRRTITQGTDGAATVPATPTTRPRRRHSHQSQPQTRTNSFPSQHGRRPSLGSIQETRLDGEEEPTSSRPPTSRPRPPSQAQTDGGRSTASGPTTTTHVPPTSQRSNNGPAPPLPPVQQFPAGPSVPRDDVSEATTSPASTMTGIDILTFREAPVVSTSPNSSPEIRRSRGGGQTNTTSVEDVNRASTSGGHPPVSRPPATASRQTSPPGITVEPPPSNTAARPVHQQHPPVVFQPDENLLTPTFLPSHTLPRSTSANSISLSTRSSFSFDIQIESPSQPSTPRENEESSSNQDGHYLSPNGSRPVSLPRAQPQPHVIQPHESPVLPVLPRIVSQPTAYGTPAVRPLDLQYGNDIAGAVYEEAPTPPGFQYPLPLGAAISGGVGGKGKGKSVTHPPPQSPAGGGGPSYYAASPYVSKPDASSVSTSSQQPVVPPVVPNTSSLSSSSSTITPSSQQPVVPPVTPGIYHQQPGSGNHGNGHHRNGGSDDEDLEEDTSFDSATKRNTQWNSRMSRQGKWGK